jgi:PAS domain S-box-containing protein
MADKGVILIVDDTLTNLEVLFGCLTDAGFKILVAEDGESAIANAKYALPDLILLDILMPGLDGFETCRRLKTDEATAEIPVIFMTALAETVDKVKGFSLGAVDYITKPFQQEEVLARVQTHVSLRQLTRQLREKNERLEQEIQERQRKEAALSQSEERFRLVVEGVKDYAIFMLDPDGRIVSWNAGARRIKGYQADEIIGQSFSRFYPNKDVERGYPQQLLATAADVGRVESIGWRVRKDGSRFWANVVITALRDREGNLRGFSKVTRDITDAYEQATLRQQAEEALRESEERFHQAFENAAIGMALVSLDGHWLQINRSLCEMLGYSEQELLATTFQAVTHPDDLEIGLNYFQQMLSGEIRSCQFEKRYLHKLGHTVWAMLSSSMIRDARTQPLYIVTQIEDITARKQALEELRNLSKALESAVEGIAQLDTQGRYIKINPAYANILGYQPEELVGKTWQQTVYPDDLETVDTAYQRMLIDGKAEVEARTIRKDGTVFDKQTVMVKAYDQQQQFIGSYCFVKDISDRREIERLKDEFISVVSHELRTPLTSISAALDLLAGGVLQNQPEDAQQMLSIAANNTDRLVRLINDILDIERIESGKIVMTKQACDAADLMNQSVEAIQEIAEKAGITLSVSSLSIRLWADPDRIIQVLTNLLSNAIKFSSPGSTVWLSAELIRGQELEELNVERLQVESSQKLNVSRLNVENLDLSTSNLQPSTFNSSNLQPSTFKSSNLQPSNLQPSTFKSSSLQPSNLQPSTFKSSNLQPSNLQPSTPPDTLLINVKDQGRGIPSDKLESIFERFQQVDASDSRQKGGTGLGLAICRSILQQHEGQIWAESTLGEGSTFYFTLPIHPDSQPSEFVSPNSESASLTVLSSELADSTQPSPLVLVCDDDSSVRTVIKAMLERQGYRVLTVASGYEAVEQSVIQQPDVILLNLMMPGMDGWETLAVLKQQTETQAIPTIVLSGLLPDAREAPHPDVSDWIVKPPEPRVLRQALERILADRNQIIKVLIVEDDIELAQVLATMFSRHGIETFHAQSGREAIQVSQRIIPDLLVLDLALPEYNGFAVVDWLRQHNRLCQVPLVVYTAQDLDESDRERLKLGQTLFFTKGRITSQEFEQRTIDLLNRII